MMGPLYRYRDRQHLDELIQAAKDMGCQISISKERSITGATSEDDNDHSDQLHLSAITFSKGRGKVIGTLDEGAEDPIIYFGLGHAFNPLRWKADGRLSQEIGELFCSHRCERVDLSQVEDEE